MELLESGIVRPILVKCCCQLLLKAFQRPVIIVNILLIPVDSTAGRNSEYDCSFHEYFL